MSNFVLHSIPGSPFGRSVLIALEEKGARYTLAPVKAGDHKQEPYISLQPFGRIPAFEHDGFKLYETQAILRYLDRALPNPALTPTDPKLAARMDQVLNICDWYLFQGVNNVIGFQRVVGPRVMGMTPDEAAIAAAMPKAHIVFNELSRLLGDQPYFAGDKLSLADLHDRAAIRFPVANAGMGAAHGIQSEPCRLALAPERTCQREGDDVGSRGGVGEGGVISGFGCRLSAADPRLFLPPAGAACVPGRTGKVAGVIDYLPFADEGFATQRAIPRAADARANKIARTMFRSMRSGSVEAELPPAMALNMETTPSFVATSSRSDSDQTR
jgi:glutathione S-transferase